MDIITLAFTLLQLLGTVESLAHTFHRTLGLDGKHIPGAFQTHSRIYSETMCAGVCISNGCVTFVYHAGDKKCYLHDSMLTSLTPTIAFPGTSVAYSTMDDVLKNGKQLYRYFPESNEGWIISLTNDLTWVQAKDNCSQKGGLLLSMKDATLYSRFNKLDTDYAGLLRPTNTDRYWVGMNDIDVEGTWKNIDLSTITSFIGHYDQPSNLAGANCGVLFHYDGYADQSFKFGDAQCSLLERHICSYNTH